MDIYVKDYILEGLTDSQVIKACLDDWRAGSSQAQIIFNDKDWKIDEAILLSNNMTIIIDNCTIQQKNEVFDNVFRGDNLVVNPEDKYGIPLAVTPISNIKILGKRNAKIVGPQKNRRGWHSVLQLEQEMVGDFWGWRAIQICLSMCDNFEISGLTMEKTRSWAMSFELSANGYIHAIHFNTNVKNGDGIDFRAGCHDCRVENITGYTSDDTVACTALYDMARVYPYKNYLYPLEPALMLYKVNNLRMLDIHDIKISKIYTGGQHHGIICLASGGLRIYNIEIKEVRETLEGEREATVKIYTGYGSGYNDNDLHNIRIDEVTSQIAKFSFLCNAKVNNLKLSGIKNLTQEDMKINISNPDGITVT